MRRIKNGLVPSFAAGFSLIELLVVISISGIIIAVASTSYTTAQRQARDSRRMNDIKTIQAAMEQYFTIYGFYPTQSDGNLAQAFQSQVPLDPKGLAYNFDNTDTDNYCVCATLEGTAGNADTPTSTTCTWNSTGTLYCAQNQQ